MSVKIKIHMKLAVTLFHLHTKGWEILHNANLDNAISLSLVSSLIKCPVRHDELTLLQNLNEGVFSSSSIV